MMEKNHPVSVVSPSFCFPHPIDLAITRKFWKIGTGNFAVNDVRGNLIFKVEEPLFTFREKRVILDAAGRPIVTLRENAMSRHSRWKVFRGDSTDDKDLIFSGRRSSMFQWKTKLNVFLANNKSEDVCDYKVRGSWSERSCKVYVGDSSTIIAQMHKKTSAASIFLGKDKFMVTVYPNIDHAFIVALIVILDEINSSDN
ncbi:LURP-one-like protein [Perilla frutescens var. frutescens]|nr:LURP-one-like protein [Perilla frutescens var. frutescens]